MVNGSFTSVYKGRIMNKRVQTNSYQGWHLCLQSVNTTLSPFLSAEDSITAPTSRHVPFYSPTPLFTVNKLLEEPNCSLYSSGTCEYADSE